MMFFATLPLSLSMPFKPQGGAYRGPLVQNYFDNLLPDSEPIRRRMAQHFQTGGIAPAPTSQSNGIWSGSELVGFDLKPEEGRSYSWGVVYDPQWAPGLSVSLDYWRMYLNDTITNISAQIVLNSCFANPASDFCRFINRFCVAEG